MAAKRGTKEAEPVISQGPSPDAVAALTPGALAHHEGTRVMFTLSPKALKLLDTAVLVDDSERSIVVETLIITQLGRYYAGKRDEGAGGAACCAPAGEG